jgi:hypothetical protein
MDLHEALWGPIALKPPYLLDFRHKKRRPWTSLDDEVVEPGGFEPASLALYAAPYKGWR